MPLVDTHSTTAVTTTPTIHSIRFPATSGRWKSVSETSLVNRDTRRPEGWVSKNDVGRENILSSSLSCSTYKHTDCHHIMIINMKNNQTSMVSNKIIYVPHSQDCDQSKKEHHCNLRACTLTGCAPDRRYFYEQSGLAVATALP